MMGIELVDVLSRLLLSLGMAVIFYLQRNCIDRRKGMLVEAASVALPVVASAVVLLPLMPSVKGSNEALAQVVQIVLLSLPIFVFARLLERLASRESVYLVDLFRITTAVSLATFVFTFLKPTQSPVPLLFFAIVFLIADWARSSSNRAFHLATLFAGSFIILSVAFVFFSVRLSSVPTSVANPRSIAVVQHGLTMIAWLLPLIYLSESIEARLLTSRLYQQLALQLASLQFAISRPLDLMRLKPPVDLWRFDRNVVYLNHGSFGAVPLLLRHGQQRLCARCENEPMNFLARELESKWLDARFHLAVWLGTAPENIAFCENATAGMNEIAHSFPLSPGDEVLLNDHEYGAVRRIWKRKCEEARATLINVTLPMPATDPQQIAEAILAGCNPRTRLVVLSHITSPTAMILPIASLCAALRDRGIASCIDGPHALLQERFKLYSLRCDFYTASCHKWLCAPIGSGMLYVDPKWQASFRPTRLSWGRVQPVKPTTWSDELLWTGTRDSSAYLMVPEALRFFSKFDYEKLDARNHQLACYARRQLCERLGTEAVTPEGREWFGWMVGIWLPEGNYGYDTLQKRLWERYRIEVPIVNFGGRYLVRVSCPQYITTHDVDTLVRCLQRELITVRR